MAVPAQCRGPGRGDVCSVAGTGFLARKPCLRFWSSVGPVRRGGGGEGEGWGGPPRWFSSIIKLYPPDLHCCPGSRTLSCSLALLIAYYLTLLLSYNLTLLQFFLFIYFSHTLLFPFLLSYFLYSFILLLLAFDLLLFYYRALYS